MKSRTCSNFQIRAANELSAKSGGLRPHQCQVRKVSKGRSLETDRRPRTFCRSNAVSKMDMGDEDSKLIEMEGMEMNMQLSGTQTGTSEIDEATGWLLRSKIEQNFFGVLKIAPNEHMPDGMSIPMTIQSTSTIEPMELE